MAPRKREAVTVTYHYLRRVDRTGGRAQTIPFHKREFSALFDKLEEKPPIDLSNPAAADKVRYRFDAPIDVVSKVDSRTISGTFKASYWGHAYDNTKRGRIPADSISLRPFHFLLYLSESGRIYVGCQYLGPFGGYQAIQNTVRSLLSDPESITASSFRLGSAYYKNAVPKEVRITFSNRPTSIASRNNFTDHGIIAFKKASKDDGFETAVKTRLFPWLGQPKSKVQKAISELLSENDLMEAEDTDIEDCTIIARVNGRKKTIHMLEGGNFATRFEIEVPINSDGHPVYDKTVSAMIDTLRDEIVARGADV